MIAAETKIKSKISASRMAITLAIIALIVVAILCLLNLRIIIVGQRHVIQSIEGAPPAQVAIVLGARVFGDNALSHVLADRVDTAIELYRAGKVEKLLFTGDHGRAAYDEVNAMRRYALSKGIAAEDIFLDHAGFNTFDSMYRARDVFQVKEAIVVTQKFHLARSVYTARSLGIDAVGIQADKHIYARAAIFDARESLARVKALVQLHIIHPKPRFLGPKIPITGDGRATNDKPV